MTSVGVELGYRLPYLKSEGISAANIGLRLTAYGVAVMIASCLAGALCNRLGPHLDDDQDDAPAQAD